MICSICKEDKNRVLTSRRIESGVHRIRECLECGAVWVTIEKMQYCCPQCGEDDWMVINTRQHGADRKFRTRVCLRCGEQQYTFERKIEGVIKLDVAI